MLKNKFRPRIKICGLTRIEDAIGCVELGVDAIGCVFYPKSPRHLTQARAREICSAMPERIKTVGVFVNETFSDIMQHVEHCRLSTVQLHGHESPELVRRLRKEKLHVIKALFVNHKPYLKDVAEYQASAFLVECGQGKLPGGNALEWNWKLAKSFGEKNTLIIAGGLAPENVAPAVEMSVPHGVDVSSGVEEAPGQKDLDKIKAFMDAVSSCGIDKNPKNSF
jgi:phosphoribosylanthranilate isomerase